MKMCYITRQLTYYSFLPASGIKGFGAWVVAKYTKGLEINQELSRFKVSKLKIDSL